MVVVMMGMKMVVLGIPKLPAAPKGRENTDCEVSVAHSMHQRVSRYVERTSKIWDGRWIRILEPLDLSRILFQCSSSSVVITQLKKAAKSENSCFQQPKKTLKLVLAAEKNAGRTSYLRLFRVNNGFLGQWSHERNHWGVLAGGPWLVLQAAGLSRCGGDQGDLVSPAMN